MKTIIVHDSQIGLSLPGLAIITRRPLASRPGAANRYLQNMIIHLFHTCVLPPPFHRSYPKDNSSSIVGSVMSKLLKAGW